jgi:hypothetical protein
MFSGCHMGSILAFSGQKTALYATADIIRAAGQNRLPGQIMFTMHPQR